MKTHEITTLPHLYMENKQINMPGHWTGSIPGSFCMYHVMSDLMLHSNHFLQPAIVKCWVLNLVLQLTHFLSVVSTHVHASYPPSLAFWGSHTLRNKCFWAVLSHGWNLRSKMMHSISVFKVPPEVLSLKNTKIYVHRISMYKTWIFQ